MKNKITRKGFTIVELVIVIAVIAILAAVLIPTFSNIIQKSKVSSDQQLIRNLNSALTTDAAVNGKHANMQSALDTAFEYGYDVGKINATATNNEILWDQVNDVFCYLDGDEIKYIPNSVETGLTKNDYRLWVISDKINQNYSTYYTGTETTINTAKGFDAGKSAVSTINYTNNGDAQKDVIIRTTTGTLTINAEKDTVHHYGEGLVLTIDAIEGNSYHEHGYFPKASISMGRLVVEEGNIPSVEIASKDNTIKIESNKDIVVSASQAVVEALGSNLLANVDVKVTSSEAKVVVDEKINPTSVEVNGKTAEAESLVSITKVKNIDELRTAITDMKPYIMLTNDITFADTTANSALNVCYSVTIDGDGHKLEGYGRRGTTGNYPTLAFNHEGSNDIDVVLSNITVKNTLGAGRPVETRGHIKSLTIKNSIILATGSSGNNQGITIGGAQSTTAIVLIENSTINAGRAGYPIISFNPFNAEINNSLLDGYCGIYFKNDTYGAQNCDIVANNTVFNSPNSYSIEGNNSFGVFAIQQGVKNNKITLNNCKVNNQQNDTAYQSLVSFGDEGKHDNTIITINGTESYINGTLSTNGVNAPNSRIVLNGGTYTYDPLDDNTEISGDIVVLGNGKAVQKTIDFTWIVN